MSVVRQLHQLQLVDSEYTEKANRLAQVQRSLGETRELLVARVAVVESQEALNDLRTRLHDLELVVASVSSKLKGNQQRMYGGKVRNPKELSNLQEEASALKRRLAELEDEQLGMLITLEEDEAELAERRARLGQIESTWRKDQAALQEEKANLDEQLARLVERQKAIRGDIGPADLVPYDDLRARLGGTAVTELRRGICQSCGVDVPTGVARAVERGDGLHYCPVCARLLYGGA